MGNTDEQKMVYDALKAIFSDFFAPQRLVLETGGEENKLYVIGDRHKRRTKRDLFAGMWPKCCKIDHK